MAERIRQKAGPVKEEKDKELTLKISLSTILECACDLPS